jgi:type VI secretion system secreted protein VgrG
VTSVPYSLPEHKTKTVLRSHSSPHNGGYNELSLEDRAGQEKIYLRAQRDIEQLILNDSATQIGHDRREQITRDSHSLIGGDRFEQVDQHSASLIKGDETHTTQGLRNTVIGGDELISISGNSSMTAAGTLVIQAGPQAHVTAANVVIEAGTSLTLRAGGHHIVINAGGIFSSVAIVEGGSPVAGMAAQSALSVIPQAAEAMVIDAIAMEALLKQEIVFREVSSGICPVCDAAQESQTTEGAEA